MSGELLSGRGALLAKLTSCASQINCRLSVCLMACKGVFIATQLNSTDPVEQRTAKSVVFLFMTSRPTN